MLLFCQPDAAFLPAAPHAPGERREWHGGFMCGRLGWQKFNA
jgi:hypothetical protein